MSTYNDASLIYYPSGYKAGTAYSLKPTDGTGDLTFTRASTATRVNESGLIEEVAANVPRLDNSQGGCSTLLLEPQRTNLATNSLGFSVFSGASIASETTENPLGDTSDVFKTTYTSLGGVRLNQNVSLVSGNTYCIGSFIKFSEAISLMFEMATSIVSTSSGTFNFDASGNPSVSGDVYYINYPNGWYYVYIKSVIISSGLSRINLTANSGSFLIYKSQYELGSYPTSYIPTTTTAVTRVLDNASVTTPAGVTQITETFADGSTCLLYTSPSPRDS